MSTPQNLCAVIMAGGAGTRFWPLSTAERPKQFLSLLGERSLLQSSFDRLRGLVPPERVLVLTSERFVPLVREQLPMLPPDNVVGEPMRRDTAAAVALAALLAKERFGDAVMAVLTSDHRIEPVELFQADLRAAALAAEAAPRALFTFGVRPSWPATGYGYLERSHEEEGVDGATLFRLERFHEKPNLSTATRYVESGRFLWNSGMFVWKVEAICAELERQLPQHLRLLTRAARKFGGSGFGRALREAFEPLPKTSIDFGVMEGALDLRGVVARFTWSDVGGWKALQAFLCEDDSQNRHQGRIETLDARRNMVFCDQEDEVVALVGVEGLVVVRSANRTLIVPLDRAEEVKTLVGQLEARDR